MKIILASKEINLMILATKCQSLLISSGLEAEVLYLRAEEKYDCDYQDYPPEVTYAIELFIPQRRLNSLSPFGTEIIAHINPLEFNKFEKLNSDVRFEEYVSNFYTKQESNYTNEFGISSITEYQYQKEFNSSEFIGKLCAKTYFGYAQENCFRSLHTQILIVNKLLSSKLEHTISYVFPPITDFIASIEASWEPPLGYD